MSKERISAEAFIETLPADRQAAMSELRKTIQENLPDGFEEVVGSMISYIVPFSVYPPGYHCPPKQPLPFMSIASNKNFVALHHFGIYADPELLKWFTDAYPKHSRYKLEMGKSCIRFKRMNDIPFELIGELVARMTPQQWIDIYEGAYKR